MTLFLIARSDGSLSRVVRAESAKDAVLVRFQDEDDQIVWGNVAVWKLGNFPTQFEVTADPKGIVVRDLGNPHV